MMPDAGRAGQKAAKAVSETFPEVNTVGMATQRSAGNPRAANCSRAFRHPRWPPCVSQPQRLLPGASVSYRSRELCSMRQPGYLGQQPGVAAPQVLALAAMGHRMSGRHSSASARNATAGGSIDPAGAPPASRPWARRASTLAAAWCSAAAQPAHVHSRAVTIRQAGSTTWVAPENPP